MIGANEGGWYAYVDNACTSPSVFSAMQWGGFDFHEFPIVMRTSTLHGRIETFGTHVPILPMEPPFELDFLSGSVVQGIVFAVTRLGPCSIGCLPRYSHERA